MGPSTLAVPPLLQQLRVSDCNQIHASEHTLTFRRKTRVSEKGLSGTGRESFQHLVTSLYEWACQMSFLLDLAQVSFCSTIWFQAAKSLGPGLEIY